MTPLYPTDFRSTARVHSAAEPVEPDTQRARSHCGRLLYTATYGALLHRYPLEQCAGCAQKAGNR